MKRIVIIGAGAAGYFTAAAIKKNIPDIDVVVVYDPNTPTIGVGEALNWEAPLFMKGVLGLSDFEWLKESRSILKIGTRHQGWDGTDNVFYAGATFVPSSTILDEYEPGKIEKVMHRRFPRETGKYDMVDMWIHLRNRGLLDQLAIQVPKNPHAAHTSQTYWYAKNNTLPLSRKLEWLLTNTNYSYHINATRVGGTIHRLVGKPAGVREIAVKLQDVVLNEAGDIDHLVLADGQKITADLFVDSSGFARVLVKKLPYEFEKLDEYFNNSVIVGPHSYKDYSEHTNSSYIRAMDQGWHFSVGMDVRSGEGYVYNSALTKDVDALKEEYYNKTNKRDVNFRSMSWEPGYYKDSFVKNCIALGLSHGLSDAFDANAFSATLSQITELVNHLKADEEFAFDWRPVFNRFVKTRMDEIVLRIQIAFHLAPKNDTEYWKEMKVAASKFHTMEKLLDAVHDLRRKRGDAHYDSASAYTQGTYLTQITHYELPVVFRPLNITPETEKLALEYFNELGQTFKTAGESGMPVDKFYQGMYPELR